MVARPRPAQVLLSRIDWWVVRIRDRWTFSGPPSSPVTPCRSIQRWTATRPAAPPQEQALVRLGSGGRAIVSGGHTGISGLDDISELIAHTHPYDLLAQGPSVADYTALNQLGQESSILLEHGQEITFGVNDPAYLKLFGLGG